MGMTAICSPVVSVCSGEGVVYQVDEATGGLEVTHKLALSSRDFAGDPGPVGELKICSCNLL